MARMRAWAARLRRELRLWAYAWGALTIYLVIVSIAAHWTFGLPPNARRALTASIADESVERWPLRLRRIPMWGCSSAGRALPLQGRSQGFESPQLHQVRSFIHAADPLKRVDARFLQAVGLAPPCNFRLPLRPRAPLTAPPLDCVDSLTTNRHSRRLGAYNPDIRQYPVFSTRYRCVKFNSLSTIPAQADKVSIPSILEQPASLTCSKPASPNLNANATATLNSRRVNAE